MNKHFCISTGTFFLLLITLGVSSKAATFTVTNNNSAGGGSFRQAVADAGSSGNASDTIQFAANVRGRILLTGSGIPISKPLGSNLTIIGPGANALAIEGDMTFRILQVDGGNIRISGLRISRGLAPVASFINQGGGIWVVEGANLTLENCRITSNGRAGIFSQSDSTLNINNVLIAGNDGGGISGAGALNISNSTISDNFGGEVGGISWINGSVTLTNTTVSGNRAFEVGGLALAGTATIRSSTITDNGNVSPAGNVGGLNANSATLTLVNTIVARNLSSSVAEDVSGAVLSQGNNLIGNTTGGSGFIASDRVNMNPRLVRLANNGGPTFTHSLLPISPAINGGNNAAAPATDQRGVARPAGAAVDIGAFESIPSPAAFGKIVFVSDRNGNREIYSINANGSNTVRLTTNSANDEYPDWLFDGSKIAFSSDRAGNFEIYTMNADGSNVLRLTTHSMADSEPAFSPDGSKILFVRSDPAADKEIFIMDPDGSNQVQLTNNTTDDGSPSWSPDGTQIVFTCSNAGSTRFAR